MKDMTTEEHIKHIYERLDDLTRAMLGDQTYGSLGYRQRIETAEARIESHDERMDKIDKRFEKVYQRIIGITIGVTIATSSISWVIQNSVIEAEATPIEAVERIEVPPAAKEPAPILPPYTGHDLENDTVSLNDQ